MTVKQRIKEVNLIIKGIDDSSTAIGRASIALKEKSIDKAIAVNKIKKAYTASSLVAKDVDSNLNKIIKDSKKDFKDFLQATERYLVANYSINLTKKDIEAIAKKGSLVLSDLLANTKILKEDLQALLTQNLAKGVSEKQLVTGLKELYPAYARNASTIINTGLGRLFTDINKTKFEEAGQEFYVYAGPDDAITRDNPCKHWVWHWFPASELSQVTAIRNTLYNCRHSIIPITKEDIKDYTRLVLSAGQ